MPPRKKKPERPTPVEAIEHQDTRANIPTGELRDFVADDENEPETLLYPRDPSLDPQLVWRGKDDQDLSDLEVPAAPIYIQEKIDPRSIIEHLRDTAAEDEDEPELHLFDDFDGLDFTEKVDFYEHEANWSNRMILGDSLEVMASLAEKEGLRGKVQCIYVDPPYGIKFGSNWQVSTRKRDVKDGKASDATRQPEQVKAFRDTWELGIHSYLSYLRDRFSVARDLLTESGSIFVQIGDENVHLVRSVLDEVFGSENFVSLITQQKTTGAGSPSGGTDVLAAVTDYLIWYSLDRPSIKYRDLLRAKGTDSFVPSAYNKIELPDGSRRPAKKGERAGDLPAGARLYALGDLTSQSGVDKTRYEVEFGGKTYTPNPGVWKTSEPGMRQLIRANRVDATKSRIGYVRYLDDFPAMRLPNIWTDTVSSFMADKTFVVQTNTKVIERCLLMATDPGDLVLDPTCGSGTTATVAEQWGRRWITIDTSRVALALARTRLMSAKYPYYLLADSSEGAAAEAEIRGTEPAPGPFTSDVRQGFVSKRVPHITLKSIANNPDIKKGMSREEIDEAIARHSDQELLVDQPYEDKKRIRVAGRFTVESLAPHRVLTTDDEMPRSERDAESADAFVAMILDNLRAAGVQNQVKDERLEFDRLEAFAGEWIDAEGEYVDKSGQTKRVAVAIGPEHGTVGPMLVKEAAKEAVKGVGFDVLVVCGFAFDPQVGEEATRYGKLQVLLSRMNPDLAMGDSLLKKTGSGNLFMVFGEPDLTVKEEGGELNVELRGVDVYDPTTGDVRSDSTDDVACWFIDTNYDGESFFVRHAYFTGGGKPYDKLQRALKAEIDPDAWQTLYSTVSRFFAPPETGKIAVKVINHYGDEVLKVYVLA